MPEYAERWQLFFEWMQILSAFISIIGLPFAFLKIKSYLKPYLIVAHTPNWMGKVGEKNLEWQIEIVNRTKRRQDFEIFLVPVDSVSSVRVAWIDYTKHNLFEIENSVSRGKAHIKVIFWPENKNLFLNVCLDEPTYLSAFSDQYEIISKYFSDNLDLVNSNHPILMTAKIRLFSLSLSFAIVGLIALVRIIWLGYN